MDWMHFCTTLLSPCPGHTRKVPPLVSMNGTLEGFCILRATHWMPPLPERKQGTGSPTAALIMRLQIRRYRAKSDTEQNEHREGVQRYT